MNLTTEQIQAILDNAPEHATHYIDGHYWCIDAVQIDQWTGKYWKDGQLMCVYKINRLSDLREILELRQEVERLKANRETNYKRWQAKYQQLKDGLTLTECYECGTTVHELSPRSRCCMCEYGRANFNEKENNQLREREQ